MATKMGGLSTAFWGRAIPVRACCTVTGFVTWLLAAAAAPGSQIGHLPPQLLSIIELHLMVRPAGSDRDPDEVSGAWTVEADEEWGLRMTTERGSFVHIIGYSEDAGASLIWPPPDDLARGRMTAGIRRNLPGEGLLLPVSRLTGHTSVLVLVSRQELSEISSTLVRIETQEGELPAVRKALAPHAIEVAGRRLTPPVADTLSQPHRRHVLDQSGETIQSLLGGDKPVRSGPVIKTDDNLIVVVEPEAAPQGLQDQKSASTDTIVDRVKRWFSFANHPNEGSDSTTETIPESAAESTVERTVTKADPQLQGLADALELDVSLPGDVEPEETDPPVVDNFSEEPVQLDLFLPGLDRLLPPRNRGGAMPTLRFPAPRVNPPMPTWLEGETVKIATSVESIEQLLFDLDPEAELLAELPSPLIETVAVTMDNPEPEGKLDQLLDKLFPSRSRRKQVELPQPAEQSGDLNDAQAQTKPEPEVVVVGTRRQEPALASIEDDAIVIALSRRVTEESTAKAIGSGSDMPPTSAI